MDRITEVSKWFEKTWLDALIVMTITAFLYWLGRKILGTIVRNAVAASGRRNRNLHRKDIEKRQNTLASLVVNIWGVLVLVTGLIVLLKTLFPQIDLAPLFASAGIVGVALGFGSQSLVKDFISGIFIVSENQYRVGDIIDINGNSGTVERIGTRSTVIRDADGNVHYFPNGSVQHVINKTMGYSMARFTVSLQPTNDLEAAIDIINATGTKLAGEKKWQNKVIEAPVFVSLGEFTGTSVKLTIAGKTQPSDQWAVISEMRRRLLEAFEENDIILEGAPAPKNDTNTPAKTTKKK
jgi:moderate conductance mechanosensitive channel